MVKTNGIRFLTRMRFAASAAFILILAGCAAPETPAANLATQAEVRGDIQQGNSSGGAAAESGVNSGEGLRPFAVGPESAGYSLFTVAGLKVANVNVSLTTKAGVIELLAEVQTTEVARDGITFRPKIYSWRATINASTGAVVELVDPTFDQRLNDSRGSAWELLGDWALVRPSGGAQWAPSPENIEAAFTPRTTQSSQEPQRFTREVIPLGPQWALLGLRTNALEETVHVGPFSGNGTRSNQGWSLLLEAPCQTACWLGSSWVISMQGKNRLLPDRFEWHLSNSTVGGILVAESFGTTESAAIVFEAPGDLAYRHGPCSGLPCDTAPWPDQLAIRPGVEAVVASPAWQAWTATAEWTHLSYALIFPGGMLGGQLHQSWLLSFVNSNGMGKNFSAERYGLPGGAWGPISSTPAATEFPAPRASAYAGQTDAHLADLGKAVEALTTLPGFNMQNVGTVEFEFRGQADNPESESRYPITLHHTGGPVSLGLILSGDSGELRLLRMA